MIVTILWACAATFTILMPLQLGKNDLSACLLACLSSLGPYDAEQDGHPDVLALLRTSRAACSAIRATLTGAFSTLATSLASPPDTS